MCQGKGLFLNIWNRMKRNEAMSNEAKKEFQN